MGSELEVVTIARSTSEDGSYGVSKGLKLLDAVDAQLETAGDVQTPATLVVAEPGTIGAASVSYGIADILFPMTPPKPKGARLVRGPLRFN
jgi:hypothetical protein